MGRAAYTTAGDGLPARVAPDWTETKLRILSAYVDAFRLACKRAGHWAALDLFAGGGLNYSKMDAKEIPGSTMRILDAGPPYASTVVAAEHDPALAGALTRRLEGYGGRAVVRRCDGVSSIGDLLSMLDARLPTFAFLDPEGTELDWGAVEAIARHKEGRRYKVEQLILFPTDTGFVRLLGPEPRTDFEAKVTRMFGSTAWRPISEARRRGEIEAATARERYIRLYVDGLRRLGYRFVMERRIEAAVTRAPRYYLIFATDNDAGQKIMNHCFNMQHVHHLEPTGQGSLFQMPATPRKTIL